MNRLALFLITLLTALTAAFAASDDEANLSRKAQRYLDEGEYPNASALYTLLIDKNPKQSSYYGSAIVANYMQRDNDTIAALAVFDRAMKVGIPIDTLFNTVREVSFAQGQSSLYEDFLIDVRAKNPWLGRVIDVSLMNYYEFRGNGPQIIRYSQIMLEGLPDDVRFLRSLANGYMLSGDTPNALSTWLHIIDIYPDNYLTLLDLGNYYRIVGNNTESVAYLTRAYAIRQTPYVEKLLQ
jgi:tetratricopeptide (TPR) repeat protein